MWKKRFVAAAVLLLVGMVPLAAAERNRPNLLIIVADDMGFSDAGCYGGEIATPNLDMLARNGLRFSQFYNTGRCWTTRVSLLSGLYSHYGESIHMGKRKGIATRLLPELLKPLGYHSYHSGKWHVRGVKPTERGFEHSFYIRDQDRFFSPRVLYRDDKALPAVDRSRGFYATQAIADEAMRLLRFHSDHHGDAPFFLYLAFTSPHFPLHALSTDIDRYAERYRVGWDKIRAERWQRLQNMGVINGRLAPREPDVIPSWNLPEKELQQRIGSGEAGHAVPWESLTPDQQAFQSQKMAIHAAMVDRMDREIGRVLDQVQRMGCWENTLTVFLSDNGASAEQIIRGDGHSPSAEPGSADSYLCLGPGWSTAANTPFRLHKSWVHEGGIATPLIAHWPSGISQRGQWRRQPGHVVDIVPTVVELTGASIPQSVDGLPVAKPHGQNLLSAIRDDTPIQRPFLFWEHIGHRAWREGDWKLVSRQGQPWELYNLASDRTECADLADRHADRVDAMARRWAEFYERLMP